MSDYSILEAANPQGFQIIRLEGGEFDGIEYSYSNVRFDESTDDPVMLFEYHTDAAIRDDRLEDFQQKIASILEQLIMDQLSKNEVVYAGGVD